MENLTEKEKYLWKKAKKRVEFKRHLSTYVIINTMFWAIWFFSGRHEGSHGMPWPVWPMFGWGIGIGFHFLGAYVNESRYESIEKEYEKLKNKQ